MSLYMVLNMNLVLLTLQNMKKKRGVIMIEEKQISSINELLELTYSDDFFGKDILNGDRKKHMYVFRGLSNEKYPLETSLKRNLSNGRYDIRDYENRLLVAFQKYGSSYNEQISLSNSGPPRTDPLIWKTMIIARHHGLPTRLLDWTFSPLIALHFATHRVFSENKEYSDAVIWAVNKCDINNQLRPEYRDKLSKYKLNTFTFDMLNELKISIDKYDYDMYNSGFLFAEPPSINDRIVAQASIFSIMPTHISNLVPYFYDNDKIHAIKIILNKNNLYKMREILDSMFINERLLMPGLDGLAQFLSRRFHQGNDTQ